MTSNWKAVRGDRTPIYITLHIGERFGAMNLLSVVNLVSSSPCLCELVCNGIDCVSSVALIVTRCDAPTLRIVADQTVRFASRRSNLQATAARGCAVPSEGLTVGRLHGERLQTIGAA